MPTLRRLLLAVLVVVAAPAPALAAGEREGSLTSFDGTKISWYFFPADGLRAGQRAPVVMNGPGYSSGGAQADDGRVQRLRKEGWNVLTWDPRGFGNSGDRVRIDSPEYEGRDAQALVDLLAGMPEVRLDAPGDPRLGMIGESYGGGIQNVLAAIDRRVDVIAPSISWHSLVTSLDKSDTAKGGWGSVLYGAGAQGAARPTNGPSGVQFGRVQDPMATSAVLSGLATGEFTQAQKDFFAARGPGEALIARHTVPTLITQSTTDTLFTLQEAIRNYEVARRTGVPLAMTFFCGGLSDPSVGHGVCQTPKGPDPDIVLNQGVTWLKRWLDGDRSVDTGPGFRWVSDRGVLRHAAAYPPAPGTPVTAKGSGTLVTTTGDTSGALVVATRAANAVNTTFDVKEGTQLLGEPSLALTYTGTAPSADGRVYAQLVDETTGDVLGNTATPIKVTLDGAPHTLRVPLEAIASDALAGQRYTLQLIGGSDLYFAARQPATITFSSIHLSIPTVAPGASSTDPKAIRAATPAPPSRVTATCGANRSIVLRLHARKGTRLVRAKVYIDGRLRRTVRGRSLRRITIKGLGGRPRTVRVDTFTRKGLAVRSTRRVDACGKASGLRKQRRD